MEQINKYENGKIYKLIDKTNDNKVIYVGSTIFKLNERLSKHKADSKIKPNRKIYKYICNVGWDNINIELIEEYQCYNRKELEVHERYHINELNPDLNDNLPGRTQHQWYNDNKDDIQQHKKEYYEKNKDFIKETNRKYREQNINKIKEIQKDYRDKNKSKIVKYRQNYYNEKKQDISMQKNKSFLCCCGVETSSNNKARHEKSKKHMTYINNLNEINL